MLGPKDFLELANHVLKGDQLIVRGCDVTTVTSIISILKVCAVSSHSSALKINDVVVFSCHYFESNWTKVYFVELEPRAYI